MPKVRGWARKKKLSTGKEAMGLLGQPEVDTPIKGCTKEGEKGTSHQIRGLFKIYVLCDKLRTGLGNTVKDTGFQV